MNDLSQGDRYLLDQLQQRSSDGWSQLIQRYQGRLIAFARTQLANTADAEDAVQETFLSFITGLPRFRGQASIETYLFSILRRKLVDHIRRHGRVGHVNVCSLQDTLAHREGRDIAPGEAAIAAPDPSPSWYVVRKEDHSRQEETLWNALREFIQRLKQSLNFRDLQLCELVFYAQLRNKDIAAQMQMDEKQVALLKHRFIKRISQFVGSAGQESAILDDVPDTLLTRVWEEKRPSCPKRSTIGKYLLGTLDPSWQQYVDFHLNRLGCRFCLANYRDLDDQTSGPEPDAVCDRIFHSTVGFLRKT